MKQLITVLCLFHLTCIQAETVELTTTEFKDKIKGAWAAQVIGVTYGFPVEFKYMSTYIPDNHQMAWSTSIIADTFRNTPGAYDDIYVDLTFVNVIEQKGLDAAAKDYALALAHADFPLWFANQVSRNNILNGVMPPESGHWQNNPAADDIDFQIESDFIGIMTPGMTNTTAQFADKIGHIMSYGDGYYGGLFVAGMYSQAYIQHDIVTVINRALQLIPAQSDFHKIISDVIAEYDIQSDDWQTAWFHIHRRWAQTDKGAKGVEGPFNIDAKINSAWVVMALLYGKEDFSRTIDIATRAGDDADCNPATAAGVLGTLIGYSAIPQKWTAGLAAIEDETFPYTQISLNKVYELSYQHAIKNIVNNSGVVSDNTIKIAVQEPKTVDLEVSFPNNTPQSKKRYDPFFLADYQGGIALPEDFEYQFNGNGFVIVGEVRGQLNDTVTADIYIDGKHSERVNWPVNYLTRRFYLAWNFKLPTGPHVLKIKLAKKGPQATVQLNSIVTYRRGNPVEN